MERVRQELLTEMGYTNGNVPRDLSLAIDAIVKVHHGQDSVIVENEEIRKWAVRMDRILALGINTKAIKTQ